MIQRIVTVVMAQILTELPLLGWPFLRAWERDAMRTEEGVTRMTVILRSRVIPLIQAKITEVPFYLTD
jgi:hypothetical protein